MKYIYIGDIVNTHGLKGEVRLISDFEYKKKDFLQILLLIILLLIQHILYKSLLSFY